MSEQIRILIIDNSVDFTRMFKARLELHESFQVVGTANDGESALRHLKNKNIDVVFLDIVMPGMDGIELLQRINEIKPKPVVIVVSALDTDSVTQRVLSMGATHYFNKPFDFDTLIDAINDSLK